MELRYDSREHIMHIADGSQFLCDKGFDDYETRRPQLASAIPIQHGELKDMDCVHCHNTYQSLGSTQV